MDDILTTQMRLLYLNVWSAHSISTLEFKIWNLFTRLLTLSTTVSTYLYRQPLQGQSRLCFIRLRLLRNHGVQRRGSTHWAVSALLLKVVFSSNDGCRLFRRPLRPIDETLPFPTPTIVKCSILYSQWTCAMHPVSEAVRVRHLTSLKCLFPGKLLDFIELMSFSGKVA